ncbi:Hemicentin-1,Coadhesin,Adhesion G protein-coupled receptor B3,Thrombospondin-2,Thrombospondin-1,Mucin-like protein [Mytilus edulis]|uniref:Hemicentin-1,Coadhesin,Adhesion G protein-coupled receptor B3,Thrombospondin-2,Thrombospondin-1,Mucin-like protein n=1 Tax=Mytilus edulis TaxID=6550 RepID=A0A8S3QFE7_MYTED|nr:Hemicentin-1,Coadhesin,Adhesion G protein-coupled receptor B3,Thrombospondin-2,Thrombospondin-1,Mucin-like protein [Mytilus edulis]
MLWGYGSFEGDLRLNGGNNPEEGRLEIYHNSQWGTICNDNFDTPDAVVACRQLGYRTPTPIVYTAGGGSDPIWLVNMACDGTEMRIDSCRHSGWGIVNCNHGKDVGVRCTGEYVVNGAWGYWSAWSSCNSTCGSGTRQRTRRCDNPFPAFGGSICVGNSRELQTCAGINGNWGSWSVWTVCSSSCDSGYQTRSRLCNNPVPSLNGTNCNGKSFEVLNCSIAICTVNGNWGSWSVWTVCSSSCDSGYQTRSRLCDNPVPSSNGAYCKGKSFEALNCSLTKCTVNGNWGSWSYWTICSSSCDSGYQTRSRLCNDPVPSSNGAYCNGKSFEVLNCSITRCTVDGSWGGWGKWSECNATCDGGVQKRTRYCNNPYPSVGGSACSGMADQILICAEINCPVIGAWSEWGVWSLCSNLCGSGNRTRRRLCDNPPPSYGGEYCNGNTLDSDTCNTHECPIDGDWSEWSSWDTCSATCNGGIQDRKRKCDAPLPSNGGRYCNGFTIESRSCNNENCKIDGQWGAWQEWQPCNTTCGNGSKHRIRECDSPSPYFGGAECMGLDFDIQTCFQDICPDAHLQVKKETSNTVSSALFGGVAVACIVVTVVIMCIALFVFRRFRPGKVAKRKKSGCHTESLAELRSGVYDTCRNTNSNVYANTQFTADNIETGARANASCNADNVKTRANPNITCNADNVEKHAHAKIRYNADKVESCAHANIPCNADNVEEIYENLKIR